MSNDDDTRVLNMRINNKDFLQGTTDSLKALDTLNKGIDSAGKGKGLQNMGKDVDTVRTKFSALQIAGVTAIANIANRAVNAGVNFVKSFTVGPLLDGYREYNKLLTSTQTIAANTNLNNKKGLVIVGNALQELNHYSDQTIYSFGQMADNIGRFTAAGVKIKDAVSSIKGLANAAALSGSTNEQLSTAMYQVSQALATGVIRLQDWNSLSNAGLGGKNIQNSLKATARTLGDHGRAMDAAIKKNGSFRQSLQAGWLNADIFNKTMKVFAGQGLSQVTSKAKLTSLGLEKTTISMIRAGGKVKITDHDLQALAKRGFSEAAAKSLLAGDNIAYTVKQLQKMGYSKSAAKTLSVLSQNSIESATKIKTFSQLIDVVKESIGSGWANVFAELFGNLGEAGRLWTNVGNKINNAVSGIFKSFISLLHVWHNTEVVFDNGQKLNGYQLLWKSFGHIMKTVGNIILPFFRAFTGSFPDTEKSGSRLTKLTTAFFKFSVWLDRSTDSTSAFGKVIQGLANIMGFGLGAIGAYLKSMVDLVILFAPVGKALLGLAQALGGLVDKMLAAAGITTNFADAFKNFESIRAAILLPFINTLALMINTLTDLVNGDISFDEFKAKISDAFSSLGSNIGDMTKVGANIAHDIISGLSNGLDPGGITGKIKSFVDGFVNFFKGLLGIHSPSTVFEGFGQDITDGLGNGIDKGSGGVVDHIKSFVASIGNAFKGIDKYDLANIVSVVSSGAVLVALARVMNAFGKSMSTFKGFADDVRNNVTGPKGILNETTKTLKAMQANLYAKAILDIAISIGILAGSLFLLSKIPAPKLVTGLAAIGLLLRGLVVTMGVMAKNAATSAIGIASISAMAAAMVLMSAAILVLSGALFVIGKIPFGQLAKGVGVIIVLMAVLTTASSAMSEASPSIILAAGALLIFSFAISALLPAILLYSKVPWKALWSGLLKMGAALVVLGVAMVPLAVAAPGVLIAAAALVVLSAGLVAMLGAILLFSKVSFGTLAKGVGLIAFALVTLGVAAAVAAPGFILLGAAAVLLGAGFLAAGVGISLFGAGLAVVVAAGAAGAAVLVASFESFLAILPLLGVQLANGLSAFLGALADKSPKIVGSLVKIIKELIKGIIKLLPDVVKLADKLVEALLQVLIDSQADLVEAGIDLIGALIKGIGDHALDLANTMGQTVLDLLTGLNEAITKYEPQIILQGQLIGVNLLLGLVKGMTDPTALIALVTGVVKILIDNFKSLLGINSPSTVFAAFGVNIIEGLANGIVGAIGTVISAIGSLVGRIISGFASMPGRARDAISGIGGILKSVFTGAFKLAVGAVTDGVSGIRSGIGKIPGILRGFVGSIGTAAQAVGHAIVQGIKTGLSKIGGAVGGVGTAVLNAVKHAINTILPIKVPKLSIKVGPKSFSIGGQTLIHELAYAKGTDFSGKGTALVGEAGPELVSMNRGSAVITNKNLVAFMKSVSTLTRTLTRGSASPVNTGGNIVYKVSADFQGDPKTSGIAFAANLAAGLVNGLSSNRKIVNDSMSSFGSGMSQSFADVMGIKSPSTVFFKYAGFVGKGFINGLLASISGVTAAAGKLADAAKNTVLDSLSNGNLELEISKGVTDAYSRAAALIRTKEKGKSKAQKKKLEAQADKLDYLSKKEQKRVDDLQKAEDARQVKRDHDRKLAELVKNNDIQGQADLKSEDASIAAKNASDARTKAIRLAKEADLVRKYDKKRAAELDKQAKAALALSKKYATDAQGFAEEASKLDNQAKAADAAALAAQLTSVTAAQVVAAQKTFELYAKQMSDVTAAAAADTPPSVTYNQTINSPEALSPSEVYRNSKNLLSQTEQKLVGASAP